MPAAASACSASPAEVPPTRQTSTRSPFVAEAMPTRPSCPVMVPMTVLPPAGSKVFRISMAMPVSMAGATVGAYRTLAPWLAIWRAAP